MYSALQFMDMSHPGTVAQDNNVGIELKEESAFSLAGVLPPEVLCEIFQAYIGSPTKNFSWEIGSVRSTFNGDSPVVLGQVCQFWRSVVLGTPMLWSTLCVEYPMVQHVPLTQLWLERAGSCPLTLVLRDFDDEDSECVQATSSILSLFIQRSQYWKKIDFSLGFHNASLTNVVNELQWDGCPNLESAAIMAFNWDQVALNTLWTKIHQSQALYHVDWNLAFKDLESIVPVHAPWKQLRHITMTSTSSEVDLCFILQACPDLISLHLSFSSSSFNSFPQTQTTLHHPHLQKLILDIDNSDASLLFDNLTLPALQSLEIRNESLLVDYDVVERIGVAVKGCLDRSKCVLGDFDLCEGYMDINRSIEQTECDMDKWDCYDINRSLETYIPDLFGELHL